MLTANPRLQSLNGPRHQHGMIAMITAIIVLVATLLAVIAVMKSVDTGNLAAGNISFRQGVIQEAERAYTFINPPPPAAPTFPFNGTPSYTDAAAIGYYAELQPATTRPDIPDLLTSSTATNCKTVSLPALGSANAVCYMVERLCTVTGQPQISTCVVPTAVILGGSGATYAADSTSLQGFGIPNVAYRLTVRVDGPRGTVGYVQSTLR